MRSPTPVTRRRFLQAGSAAGLFAVFSTPRTRAESGRAASGASPRRARNLVFVVSDGMSAGTLTMAELLAQAVEGRSTHWAGLMNLPGAHHGLQDTASADALVTDSAAAASAWGCGRRVQNGAVNVTPDGVEREPILVTARRAGKATGVVTTTRVTYATPAGFAANVAKRTDEDAIAQQYLDRGIDVMLGGGRRHFSARSRQDGRDLAGSFAQAGNHLVHDRTAFLAAPAGEGRLLGLFGDGHLPYALDREHSPEIAAKVPSLAEMTRVALARLGRCPAGFVLQVEGGRVDHAAHANDAAALVREQLDLDVALGEVLAFQKENPDTLVIATSDHGTGNPGLNGEGETERAMHNLAKVTASFAAMLENATGEDGAEALRDRIAAATGLPVALEEAGLVCAALGGASAAAYRDMRAPEAVLGQVLANALSIGWAGRRHTGDWVVLDAVGPGAEAFPGLVRNDAIHAIVLEAMGLA